MKVTREKVENSQAFLTVEMEPAEVEEYLQKAYRRLVGKAKIPGFRQGKVPRPILERYLGKEALLEEAINLLIPVEYEKAIKEENLEPIAQPEINLEKAEPVVFKAVVPLPPKVTLGDYKGIRSQIEEVAVTDEQVDNVLEHFRHRQATWEAAERPIIAGDLVTLGINSDVEGKPFINQDGVQYNVDSTSNFPAPGFATELINMSREGEKEFKLKLPDDYPTKEFAGKDVNFKVRIKEIKQEKLPEVNDEFAKSVSPESANIAELREKIKAEIKSETEKKNHADFEDKVIQAAVDSSIIEYPSVLVEREMDRLLDRQLQYMQMGSKELQEYLKSINKTGEQMREDLRPLAVKRVARSLVLSEIGKTEKIEVSDSEVEEEANKWLESAGDGRETLEANLKTDSAREYLKDLLMSRKAMEALEEIAKQAAPEAK